MWQGKQDRMSRDKMFRSVLEVAVCTKITH